jgi:DNA-binding response OmpR family regulator
MTTVLVVEDEMEIARIVRDYLSDAGFEVIVVGDGDSALASVRSAKPDLMVLDLGLPGRNGLDVAREVRRWSGTPIVMLTARGDEADRIVGLEVGADDYVAKPFAPRELLARIRAVLRRRARGSPRGEVLRFGRLEIDRGARAVRIDGEERALTAMQFDLLVALAEGAGRVQTRDAIMQKLRGHDLEAFARSIDVHVARLRAVLEDDAKRPRRILTVRGVGYVFASKQDDAESAR